MLLASLCKAMETQVPQSKHHLRISSKHQRNQLDHRQSVTASIQPTLLNINICVSSILSYDPYRRDAIGCRLSWRTARTPQWCYLCYLAWAYCLRSITQPSQLSRALLSDFTVPYCVKWSVAVCYVFSPSLASLSSSSLCCEAAAAAAIEPSSLLLAPVELAALALALVPVVVLPLAACF